MGLWTKKSIAVLQAEAAGESEGHTLRRALGALNLTTLGHRRDHWRRYFRSDRDRGGSVRGPAIVLSFIVSDSDAFSPGCATLNSRA